MEARWRDRNEYICKLIPLGGLQECFHLDGLSVAGGSVSTVLGWHLSNFSHQLRLGASSHAGCHLCLVETQVGALGNLPAAVALISDDTSGVVVRRSAAFTKSSPTYLLAVSITFRLLVRSPLKN